MFLTIVSEDAEYPSRVRADGCLYKLVRVAGVERLRSSLGNLFHFLAKAALAAQSVARKSLGLFLL